MSKNLTRGVGQIAGHTMKKFRNFDFLEFFLRLWSRGYLRSPFGKSRFACFCMSPEMGLNEDEVTCWDFFEYILLL